MKTTIRLQGAQQGAIDLEVDMDKVANASMLIYQGEHFTFRSMERHRTFTYPTFEKCDPPVDITDEAKERGTRD
jgi:hypothetical protein